jgi:hypothetical protein
LADLCCVWNYRLGIYCFERVHSVKLSRFLDCYCFIKLCNLDHSECWTCCWKDVLHKRNVPRPPTLLMVSFGGIQNDWIPIVGWRLYFGKITKTLFVSLIRVPHLHRHKWLLKKFSLIYIKGTFIFPLKLFCFKVLQLENWKKQSLNQFGKTFSNLWLPNILQIQENASVVVWLFTINLIILKKTKGDSSNGERGFYHIYTFGLFHHLRNSGMFNGFNSLATGSSALHKFLHHLQPL